MNGEDQALSESLQLGRPEGEFVMVAYLACKLETV